MKRSVLNYHFFQEEHYRVGRGNCIFNKGKHKIPNFLGGGGAPPEFSTGRDPCTYCNIYENVSWILDILMQNHPPPFLNLAPFVYETPDDPEDLMAKVSVISANKFSWNTWNPLKGMPVNWYTLSVAHLSTDCECYVYKTLVYIPHSCLSPKLFIHIPSYIPVQDMFVSVSCTTTSIFHLKWTSIFLAFICQGYLK